MSPRYLVLFKTHFWDDFTARQADRLRSSAPSARFVVAVDESRGSVEGIPCDTVLRMNDQTFVDLGLAQATTDQSLLWYNIDYPHYAALKAFPDHDFYVTCEYDVVASVGLDDLIRRLSEARIDYLGQPLRAPPSQWPWFDLHLSVYQADEMLTYLSCFAVFSRQALQFLLQRRQAMTRDFMAGRLKFWPNNEAFIPTELSRTGLRTAELGAWGDVSRYDWWPPTREADVEDIGRPAFWHPVLEGSRYLRSVLRHEPRLLNLMNPRSALRDRLGRCEPSEVGPAVRSELRRRGGDHVARRLQRLGLKPHWAARAFSPAARDPA